MFRSIVAQVEARFWHLSDMPSGLTMSVHWGKPEVAGPRSK
jgi:hypothetical protein